jgi:hypothetical protein
VELGEPGVGELDSLIEPLDLVFQPVGGDVGLAAAATAGGSGAQAVEIRVAAAVVAGGDQVGVAAAADGAVQHAFEVVVVFAFAGAAGRAGGQEVLDLLEQLGADQRLVLALDQDAVPVDHPHIGLVGQEFGHAAEAERLGWVVAATPVTQPAGGQLGGESLQGPVAGGVQLEGGEDVVGAVGVGFDAGDQPPTEGFADVVVAEGGLVGPAALFGFLGHAFADLGGQVGRVELGHQRMDALGEAALGAVVQRLDHADQLDPEAAEQGPDGDVVFQVAGEPVHLVDHHHLDVAVALDAASMAWKAGRSAVRALSPRSMYSPAMVMACSAA